jgi:hypothetical protein
VDKLSYLQSCLKGKALSSIAGYRGGENYEHAIEALQRNYGEPKKITELLQAELINMKSADDNVESLQRCLGTIERVCRQLKDMGQSEDNPFMYQVIRSKLPQAILSELIKMERATADNWGMIEFRKGLSEVVAIREEVQRCLRQAHGDKSNEQQKDDRRSQGNVRVDPARVFSVAQSRGKTNAGNSRKPPPCLFCAGDHWTAECEQISNIETRKRMLNEQERCLNCLRKGHRLKECRSSDGCRTCKERHHRAICSKAKPTDKNRDQNGLHQETTVETSQQQEPMPFPLPRHPSPNPQ